MLGDSIYLKKRGFKEERIIVQSLRERLRRKNIETLEHTQRVSDYCIEIAKVLRLDKKTLRKVSIVGELHDIGKIYIPESILLKPAKLTEREYEIMKTHSERGFRLVALCPSMKAIAEGIFAHHERWDGKGYPQGLKEFEIPILARIVSVADAFDAMTSDDRPYSKPKSMKEAIEELKKCSGTQFDPEIVDIFIKIINKKEDIA